jgi:hypothetical protein
MVKIPEGFVPAKIDEKDMYEGTEVDENIAAGNIQVLRAVWC